MANEKRLIDANALIAEYDRVHIGPPGGARKLMEDAPSVDAVEVVRCKDCKWYEPCTDWGFDEVTGKRDHSKIVEKPYGECYGQDFHFTEDGCLRVGADDFCSYGERRTDNG